MQRTIFNHEFGEIVISKKINVRQLRLVVHPSKGIRVTIPFFTSFRDAENFVLQKSDWIRKTISRQRDKLDLKKRIYKVGESLNTQKRVILFEPISDSKEITFQIVKKEEVRIFYTVNKEISSIQEKIKDEIYKYLRKEAKEILPSRIAYLANRYDFKFNKLFLKNNRSNWGSCSRVNNINLNINLVRLDTELIDFVIIHELCHLKQKNHGKEFHDMVNTLCNGKEKELNSRLRRARPTL